MHDSAIPAVLDLLAAEVDRAIKAGASAARIHYRERRSIDVGFEAGRLKDAGAKESSGYTVEVVKDGRRATASGNDPAALGRTREAALALTAAGAIAHFGAYPAAAPVPQIDLYSPATARLERERLIEAGDRVCAGLTRLEEGLFVQVGASRDEHLEILVTSGGAALHSRSTNWYLGGEIQRTRGTDILFAGEGRWGRRPDPFFDPEPIIARVEHDLALAAVNRPFPSGKVAAILAPEAVRRFLHAVFLGINGRTVAKGDSPLAGRIGERILAPTLTIVDEPHAPLESGSCAWDSAGQATRTQTLFEAGVLRRFLYDLDSAGLAGVGVESTGNNGCSPYRPVLRRGQTTSQDLIAGIGDGLLVKDLMGFGQGNIGNGDFSANVALGYRIEQGRITGRVKDTMIAGNIYDLLKNNVAVSCDTDFCGRHPWLAVEGLAVSGKP